MGKGMEPKKGYNDKKYKDNYDEIDWSSTRKNKSDGTYSFSSRHRMQETKKVKKYK